jgi:hypothetical protein
MQTEPGPHTLPHAPQLDAVDNEVHAPPHTPCPVGHAVQMPDAHIWPVTHALPHAPQLAGSFAVDVHTPGAVPQMISPDGHA